MRSGLLYEIFAASLRDWRTLMRGATAFMHGGRVALKRCLAEHAALDVTLLPYNDVLLDWLREQKARGSILVLTTAVDQSLAMAVSSNFAGLFDEVICFDGGQKLRGRAKADALVVRFGEQGFVYVGNGATDPEIWHRAAAVVFVNAPSQVSMRTAGNHGIDVSVLGAERWSIWDLLRCLRPHQWSKNLLVFVPILTAGAIADADAWWNAAALFFGFCATASGIYIINDLTDLGSDRSHSIKRQRPFASGNIPIPTGVAMVPGLLAGGAVFGVIASNVSILVVYAGLSILYSLLLREVALADVFGLASLYTVRLFGGGIVTGYYVSTWLLAFSSFLFLGLALVKRVAELRRLAGSRPLGRGYDAPDHELLQTMGVASSFASTVVLALYVQSQAAGQLYAFPEALWAAVPLVLLWQCRLWLATLRGNMNEDPILFAARDPVCWFLGAALLAITAWAHRWL